MEHLAIDLGGRESQICQRDANGEILQEERWPTQELHHVFKKLKQPNRVILETGSEAFAVARQAQQAGHEVRIVPSTLSRVLGVGARGVKTDVRDARCLSEVSTRIDLPSVHPPSEANQHRKTLCGMRDALVGARTKLINTVRGWLRCNLYRVPTGTTKTFSDRVRKHLESQCHDIPACVERQLTTIAHLTDQIEQANTELKAVSETDATCQLLMSMPGVGPVTAVQFVATLDTPTRFSGAAHVCAYLGLTPGERQSGAKQQRTGITKAGDTALRYCLVQAAWVMRRTRRYDPLVQWQSQIELRRGKHVAIVAMARKMAAILYAMWRDGKTYDPKRAVAIQPTVT